MWDTSTPFGARVEQRLNDEQIIWLVTTGKDGTPQPNPVWFLREGDTLLIYSRPATPKLHNIARSPNVALHFNTDSHGEDVVVLNGTAAIIESPTPSSAVPAYQAKYGAGIAGLGMTPQSFAEAYSAALRVTITKVRGF